MVTVTSAKTRIKTKAKRIAATATTTTTTTQKSTTTPTATATATRAAAAMPRITLQVLAANVTLLLLVLVALRPPAACALPITSKPIEGTAEHLAWQAWLMLPPEQKELEKSRKVTPKSIFTLPFRDCPPGHQLFQSRCIPTVNINQSELLTQQVLGFIVGNGGGGASSGDPQYEFDYDDEELGMSVGEEQLLMYDAPQHFHATGETSGNYDARDVPATAAAQSPPNKDEPLKFNLFQQQHFPTNDYEADSAGLEGSGAKPPLPLERGAPLQSVFNATQFLGAVQGLLHRSSTVGNNSTYNNNNSTSDNQNPTVSDLQSESSNISANFVARTTTTTMGTGVSPPGVHNFAIGDIDAIALPAVDADCGVATVAFGGDLEPQRVSLFKDDSAVQLVTAAIVDADDGPTATATATATTATTTATAPQPMVSVAQILRAEALLPLNNDAATPLGQFTNSGSSTAATATTTTKTTTTTTSATSARTPQPQRDVADGDSIRPLVDHLLGVAADSTTTTTTAMHTSMQEVAAAAEHHASERPRSVAADSEGADTEAQELHFSSTTEEPEGTTNFQIDETTVIEVTVSDSAAGLLADEQQRWAEAETDGKPENQQHVVLKKSKVEPVGEATTTATKPPASATASATTTTTTEKSAATTMASLATPLPSAMAMAATAMRSAADDRFGDEVSRADAETANANASGQRVGAVKAALSVAERRGSSFTSTSTSSNINNGADSRNKASLMAASEINIEQELRMINELVKGKRQLAKTPQATTTATATATTTASETTTTTTDEETAPGATAKNTGTTPTTTTTKIAPGTKIAPQTAETTTTKIAETSKTTTTLATASASSRVAVAKEKETTTPTTMTTITTTPQNALESGQRLGAAAKPKTTTTTTTTATAPKTTTATTTTAAATTEPISTIWSKIMPIFGFGATTTTTANDIEVPSTTLKGSDTPTTTLTTRTISMDAIETSPVPKAAAESSDAPPGVTGASLSSQRSHRNSKIIRVNHVDANNVGDSDAPETTATATTTTTSTRTQPSPAHVDIDAPDETVDDPFWWLPMGWRLDDRPSTNDDQNLLMRLWSAFPESSTKARS